MPTGKVMTSGAANTNKVTGTAGRPAAGRPVGWGGRAGSMMVVVVVVVREDYVPTFSIAKHSR